MKEQSWLKHNQFLVVAVFFIFSIFLLSLDIITDIYAVDGFYNQGDTWWGTITLILIFLPLIVRVIMTFTIGIYRCYKIELKKWVFTPLCFYVPTATKKNIKFAQWKSELKLLLWHFPMLQPVRFVPNLTNINLLSKTIITFYFTNVVVSQRS